MIEANIPLPQDRCRTEAGREAKRMSVGDSRLCANYNETMLVRKTIYALGGKSCQRKVEGGWRVWRTA